MADDKKLLNGEEPKTTESKTAQDDVVHDDDLRMGIRSWRPDWLQRFNHVNYFLAVLAVASVAQGKSLSVEYNPLRRINFVLLYTTVV